MTIKVNQRPIFVGAFPTLEEAEAAAIAARRQHMPYSEQ